MFDWVADTFTQAQDLLFQHVVMPLTYAIGMGGYVEDAYPGTEWLLMGLVQIAVMLLVLRPLERWRPVEPMQDRGAVRADIVYTLFHRLGLFPLLLFFTLQPLIDALDGKLRFWGWAHLNVEDWWPGVTSIPIVSFLVYLVLFDLLDYAYHRLSHTFHWWWNLHALHHSQQQMTLWSDDRNHLFDDLLHGTVFAVAALVIGVEPSQYVLLVAISQLLQSLQHANVRLHFGWLGDRLLISPASIGCTTPSAWGTRCRASRACWAVATSACCSRGGTCCSAPPSSRPNTTPPASATSCPRRAAARATTGAACCASSGWASSACSAAPERVRAAAWSAALLC